MINYNKSNLGTLVIDGKEYDLQEQAYVCDDGLSYEAKVKDSEGNLYKVTWNTTDKWNTNDERFKELNKKCYEETGMYQINVLTDEEQEELTILETFFNDESVACDWDEPAEITLID